VQQCLYREPEIRSGAFIQGEILREEYLNPLDMSSSQLARALHVSVPTVNDVVREKRAVSAEMAVLLARFFDTSEQFWLNLQAS